MGAFSLCEPEKRLGDPGLGPGPGGLDARGRVDHDRIAIINHRVLRLDETREKRMDCLFCSSVPAQS